ncbi:hypothetical protein BDV96DRAFT_192719 [Lophiotrema nucula]|uniref:Uncharacterized protein n=1 Tax=Lophiotrema nucula TaxID=690887 RepID=A0A6A5YUS1_9PLEO|nr:hypothetical protein BDV96DRAFT_192719 [Lophiotrema nucula]
MQAPRHTTHFRIFGWRAAVSCNPSYAEIRALRCNAFAMKSNPDPGSHASRAPDIAVVPVPSSHRKSSAVALWSASTMRPPPSIITQLAAVDKARHGSQSWRSEYCKKQVDIANVSTSLSTSAAPEPKLVWRQAHFSLHGKFTRPRRADHRDLGLLYRRPSRASFWCSSPDLGIAATEEIMRCDGCATLQRITGDLGVQDRDSDNSR